ncbi:MAG: AI-2E family transporter [Bacteriovoracia bacterium]
MVKSSDFQLRRDIIKLLCVFGVLAGIAGIFLVTPALSSPTLISIILTMLLSPLVTSLQRRGFSRSLAIGLIFLVATVLFGIASIKATRSIGAQWESFQQKAPEYFDLTVIRLKTFEQGWKAKLPFLEGFHATDTLIGWGEKNGAWFLSHGADFLSWIFLVPILTFFLLKDGYALRKWLIDLVPNRFFESSFMISSQVFECLSDYIRAKLIEAFLVGAMVTVGLMAVKAPYPVVFGVIAGVTNIIPYLGPFLGAIPGVLVMTFDASQAELIWPVVMVYLVANIIDTVLIFPVIVAKLVDLHPLLLLAAVIVGQHYYGLVGMLISVPVATVLKVMLQEIYFVVYERSKQRVNSLAGDADESAAA